MATIRKRGQRWQAIVRRKGQQLQKYFPRKSDARVWATQQEALIDSGGVVDASGRTVSDAIERFKEERVLNTYDVSVLDWWSQAIGRVKLAELRKAHIIEARKALQEQPSRQGEALAPATINRRVAKLSAVLTACMSQWYWREDNPCRGIPSLTEDNARECVLTSDQREAILEQCVTSDQPALFPFVLCAMYSGARAGELQSLRWQDVDFTRGVARVYSTKNGDDRAIPISGRALEALKSYRQQFPGVGTSFVFRNHTGSFPFNYRKSWCAARDAAGLPGVRFHDLRHDAASQLAMAGASLRELGEVLGHRSAQMVKRYSHFQSDHIAGLGEKLRQKIEGEKSS